MDNLYAIHAYDLEFGGLHGFEDYAVVEAEDDEDAIKIAEEMSREIIEDFDIPSEAGWVWSEDEEIEDMIERDLAYEVYKIAMNTSDSLVMLNEEISNDPEQFFKDYKTEFVC